MTEKDILDVHVLVRKKFNLLGEVMELSRQLGESIDRNDQVSVRMILGMRQEPIEKLEALKIQMTETLGKHPKPEEKHLRKVLSGGKTDNKAEEALKNQAKATKQLLEQVLELDERINKKIAGEHSVYNTQ